MSGWQDLILKYRSKEKGPAAPKGRPDIFGGTEGYLASTSG